MDRAPGAFPHGILDRVSDDQWQAPGRETSAGRTPPAAPDGPAPHPPPPARYAPAPGPAAPGHNPYATPAPEAAPAPGSWVHAFGATEEHRAQVLGGTGYTTPAYRNDSVAVTAMVLGILGVVLPGVCLLAIAFGHAALRRLRSSYEGGRGLAVAGLATGYAMTAIWLGVLLLILLARAGV